MYRTFSAAEWKHASKRTVWNSAGQFKTLLINLDKYLQKLHDERRAPPYPDKETDPNVIWGFFKDYFPDEDFEAEQEISRWKTIRAKITADPFLKDIRKGALTAVGSYMAANELALGSQRGLQSINRVGQYLTLLTTDIEKRFYTKNGGANGRKYLECFKTAYAADGGGFTFVMPAHWPDY